MIWAYKPFTLCWWYEKDIWGYLIVKHKIVNLGWIFVWPNVENVPHLAKKKRLLQEFSKRFNFQSFWVLNFSFEIVWWTKKKRRRKMKNWMWLFFLAKIFWLFYGNLWKQQLKNFCNLCLAKGSDALFFFLWLFEFWLPMFLYWSGFANSLKEALQWVTRGFISLNNCCETNKWKILWLYDFVSFHPSLWKKLILNLTWTLFLASKATKRWRCWARWFFKLWWVTRAHFIALPKYLYMDFWTFSFYWWTAALPTKLKYYFSVNLSNVLKFIAI